MGQVYELEIEHLRFCFLLHTCSYLHDQWVIAGCQFAKRVSCLFQDIFEVGDRVCAVIISMEDNFQRVSVSTADLEENPGDMMLDKEKVYEHGPIAVSKNH